jgi:hypothetical protein
MTDTRVQRRARRARNRRSRTVLWIVLALVLVVISAALWVGVRGVLAKNALDEAVPAATALSGQVSAGDRDGASDSFDTLSRNASEAAALTSDPVWRAAEYIPYLGANLTAVREAAGTVDDISRDAVRPLVDITASVGIDEFAPVNGAVQLQPLIDAQPDIASAALALQSANTRAKAIDTSNLIEFVADAVTTLQGTVAEASVVVDSVDRAAALLPPMMGAEGERNYLLLFQNPAELRATGGISGALAQLTVTNGAIALTHQASSADFPKTAAPVLELPLETRALYGDITGRYIQDVNLTPQFPLSAPLAAEMWRQQFGVQVDGVMSVDPVVLSYLLRATGPITLPTGDVLTSDNAVKLLLTDVYARYPDTRMQDAFFAGAAAAVFNAVASGNLQPAPLLDALAQAGDEHRLLVWSARDEEQARLAETTLAGALPQSDSETARIGVYFNDAAGSKMGTYLQTQIDTAHAVCRADGLPQLDVHVTLTNTAPADSATSLPEYVTAGGAYGVAPGNIKVITNIYGVPGSANLGLTRDGVELPHHATTDSGYPVSAVSLELAPGESVSFTSSFLADKPGIKRIVIQKTPEININPVREVELSC